MMVGMTRRALHVSPGRVVGAQLVALARVQGALQEGAEDGGLHVAPVGLGRLDQERQLVAVERQRVGVLEEAAVELQQLRLQRRGEAAGVHGTPDRFGHGSEDLGPLLQPLQ
jgi:hypothetical protein